MDSRVLKGLSHAAFAAGVTSVAVSGLTYLLARREEQSGQRNASHFIGLWAPTFFTLAEMLDRMSLEDSTYLGIPIERQTPDGVVEAPPKEALRI
jgi:hypothetical protein